jgi:hypothetical protein
MTDQTTTTRLEANGIAIEVDLRQILTALDPRGRYYGYNPETDEDSFGPSALEDHIVEATAVLLTKSLRKDIKDMVAVATRDAITAEVETIVRETMGEGVQQTTDWGSPTGAPTPLRELIGKEAEKALKIPELRDGYSRSNQKTMVQRIIANEVEKALAAELKGVVDQARKDAVAAVQTQAAAVIAESVRRATPGL